MAAYAALVSLAHTIDHVNSYNARQTQPIFSDEHQLQFGLLLEKVSILQDFLENYDCTGSEEDKNLKNRIQDVAHEAEDIIETYVLDVIHDGSDDGGIRSYNNLSEGLHNVIDDMYSIEREVMEMKEGNTLDHQISRYLNPVDQSLTYIPTEKDTTIEFGDDLNTIMDKLIGEQPDLQFIPVTGMGGIGKTTLAKNVYENPLIVEKFDVRGWVTISHEYNERDMVLCLLKCHDGPREHGNLDYHDLGQQLHQLLFGRRYLIVLDDIWSIEAWKKLQPFFPDNSIRSRVLITTRLLNVAEDFGSCDIHKMNLLDEDQSWSLLRTKVFSRETCPSELEELGKEIAKNCNGLPLSIVVIGSLLTRSKMTREYWEYVAENTSSSASSEDDECYLRILYLSYNHLPVHLKPCFLYMGIYDEDQYIRVSNLVKLWVAEGFLKSKKDQTLEEVAMDYLQELINRNLIIVMLGRWKVSTNEWIINIECNTLNTMRRLIIYPWCSFSLLL